MIKDFAIVGGGIGGCSIAALLHAEGKEVVLLEKGSTLGGCASTFHHKGYAYNAGATTLSGYHEGGIVKRLFDTVGVTPQLIQSDVAIAILQGGKTCLRYQNLDRFIASLNAFYPHPKHEEFWRLIHTIGETFYAIDPTYTYSNRSLPQKLASLLTFFPLIRPFFPYLVTNARRFIERFYGEITAEYWDFLDAQLLIVAQATTQKVNFFTAALALGYTFKPTHYPIGGMGAVCETLTSTMNDVRTRCEVTTIKREKGIYHLSTSKGTIRAYNVIMGTSHYESAQWFEEEAIQRYYQRYAQRNNHQSAFVVYMTFRSEGTFHHHYQLIADAILPFTLSQSLFVSLSDPSDTILSPQGYMTLTASIHTDARMWLGLSPTSYQKQKRELHHVLQAWICATLSLPSDAIVESFAATPKTFGRYLNRTQLGGNAMTQSNLLPFLPANDTPIEGLYHVGDTAYAAQGWPGVVMGAFNCLKVIHERD